MYSDLFVLIFKCILVGVIWSTFLLPVIFNRGSAVKFIVCVMLISVLAYIFRGYGSVINQMTLVGLIALVISWITSMAFFPGESKVKSKVIAFSSIISGLSYLVATLFVHIKIF